jgi:spermidine synthase
MAMGFGIKQAISHPSIEILKERVLSLSGLKYYTPEIHLGAFGLPKFVQNLMVD